MSALRLLYESRRLSWAVRAILLVSCLVLLGRGLYVGWRIGPPEASYIWVVGAGCCAIATALVSDYRKRYLQTPVSGFIEQFQFMTDSYRYTHEDARQVAAMLNEVSALGQVGIRCQLRVSARHDPQEVHVFMVTRTEFVTLLRKRAMQYERPARHLRLLPPPEDD